MTSNIKLQKQLLILSKILAAGVILISGFVVIVSIFNFDLLLRISPLGITMNPLAAFEYILLGFAYFFIPGNIQLLHKNRIIKLILSIVILLSILVLISYITRIDCGIDSLLAGYIQQTRMSQFTAFCLLLNSIGLMLMITKSVKKILLSQFIAFIVIFISSLLLYSFLFGALQLVYLYTSSPTAFVADICHLSIAIAIFFAYPDLGFVGEITKTKTGSKSILIFLPIAITIPVLIGWLSSNKLFAQHSPAVVFIVMFFLVICSLFIFLNLRTINRSVVALLDT